MTDDTPPIVDEHVNEALKAANVLDDNEYLTGYVLIFEKVTLGDEPACGFVKGPSGVATWRAMGMVQWVDRFCFEHGEEDM